MITTVLIDLYTREIEKLKQEILSFESDDLLWKNFEQSTMAAGNHALLITGTLQHFIGNIIGDSGYIRNKEAELKARNVPRERLLEEIDNARQIVVDTLEQVSKTDLQKVFPTNEFDEPVTTEFYLIHLLKHMSFHLGQINLLRQLAPARIES
jgi:uncharacterized damage-inducible protein DinB